MAVLRNFTFNKILIIHSDMILFEKKKKKNRLRILWPESTHDREHEINKRDGDGDGGEVLYSRVLVSGPGRRRDVEL